MLAEETRDISAKVPVNMPVLRVGTKGEAVRFLQKLLITFGYLTPEQFDADFGPITKEAVREFQATYNLLIDGIVGNKTWRKLSEVACAPGC